MRLLLAILSLLAAQFGTCLAQESSPVDTDPGPIEFVAARTGIIDLEALFLRSKYGTIALDQRREAGLAVLKNNERITEELSAREKKLSEERELLGEAEFMTRRAAFDQLVECIRQKFVEKNKRRVDWFELQKSNYIKFVINNFSMWSVLGVDILLRKSDVIIYRTDFDYTGKAVEFLNEMYTLGFRDFEIESAFKQLGILDNDVVFEGYLETCRPEETEGAANSGDNR